jgi:hypothetical protein
VIHRQEKKRRKNAPPAQLHFEDEMRLLTIFLTILLAGMCTFVYARPQQDEMIEDKDINVVAFEDVQYPPLAHIAHVQGIVVVKVGLNDRGQVVNATVLSGNFILRAVSVENAKKWVFGPPAKKTAIIVYNYKIFEGRCNHDSTLFVLQGNNIASVMTCAGGPVNPSRSQKSSAETNPARNATH